ncbi:MAG TPA: TonB-dependent receptor [Thermoanaerobaculia bacterium]|nr:TonB-dependent receptor [Thermoanaerobaculia bacterium]
MNSTKNWALRGLVLALALALAYAPSVSAQTAGSNLAGRVQDKDGGPLPGVTITATNTETGLERSGTSGPDGTFLLPSVPVGTYTVKADLDGFAPVTVESVKLNVASQRNLEITMGSSSIQEAITVVDEAPLVQQTPSIGTVVSEQQLENLPLNGRQFANLAILAPGTALAYNSDPTKPGQLTVALNGGVGRNVNYIIDGGDNTDDTIGGALQNFNLESVEEFNIQTQQYKAEYGRSTGGVLTVVTKTGTNDFKGSLWGFFRDDSLNTKTEAEKQAGIDKQPYERKQYGLAVGGPIVRDKAHFFATYEKTERETSYTIDSDPPGPLGPIFPNLQGQSVATPFEDELLTAKATYDVSAKQYLQVRYGYQKNSDKYGATSLASADALGTVTNEYSSILAGHTLQISGDTLNEFLFQYTKFDNLISADSDNPTIYFPGGFHIGQNINTPQATNQLKYQYKDDLSFTRTLWGRTHQLKTGVNYIHEPELGGDFTVGLEGQYQLKEDRVGSPVTDITIFGGFSGQSTPVDQYSGYVQDDFFFNDRLTLNFGLRYDYWEGFDLDQRSNPIWQALSTQTKYNEYYLNDFKGGRGGVLENDDNNWAPRLGFTYDLKGDGRQLLRGGWGLYYDFPYTNATILFPASAVQSNYGVIYRVNNQNGILNPNGTFFQPGQPLPPNGLPSANIPPPNEVASPTLQTPYSAQASLGYSWQATSWLGLNLEGVRINYRHIPYRFRANPTDPTTGKARFPQFGNFRMWYGDGQADYSGANLSARARLSDRFELQGFYTWSETTGNVLAGADEFRITDAGHQADVGGARRDVSINPLDPQCDRCFGPLNTDARHRVTLSGLWRAPWGLNVSGMFRYRSALPYSKYANVLVDTDNDGVGDTLVFADLNGDGFAFDLPGRTAVNSERGDSFSQLDVRLSKEFSFGDLLSLEVIGEVFNVFNEKNPSLFNRFGEPNSYAGSNNLSPEQRLAQLGLRVRF